MRGVLQRRVCMGMAGLLLRVAAAQAPGTVPGVPAIVSSDSEPLRQGPAETRSKTPLLTDLDLMRRNEFSHAGAGMVSVRVQDAHGNAVSGMVAGDFRLVVNGTERPLRLRPQGPGALAAHQAVVLLVFPPNQPTVHWMGVRDAIQYFGSQPEAMPWRVGIFDANGTFLPFTGDRQELLRNLAAVQVAKEPMQLTGYRFLPHGESTWQQKAQAAIANMAQSDGPRLVIAMNPLTEPLYGLNESTVDAPILRESPSDLVAVAAQIGAHVYIDNAGGPEVVVPGGDAAAQAPLLGTIPSQHLHIPWQLNAALNSFAYTNSRMMQTAQTTMGGYANGLKDLGALMERDLRQAYVLEFDMTARDQDRGVPEVEVRSTVRQVRLAMMDVAPLRVAAAPMAEPASRAAGSAVLAAMRKMGKPVLSGEFRIRQRVEYFPSHGGALPVLPMSCMVEWTGKAERPAEIAVAESVIDLNLSTPALERELETAWQARSVQWERDGELHPGRYAWLVAVHDAEGKILASAKAPFTVPNAEGASLGVSTLAVGATCRAPIPGENGFGLQRRPPPGKGGAAVMGLMADPMQMPGCRLVTRASDNFDASETLRSLVRIYPNGKLAKLLPEAWSGRFILRSAAGVVEASEDASFAVDGTSGLLAHAAMDLHGAGVHPGAHVLDVEVRGPGIRNALKESRPVWIAQPGP